MFKRNLKTVIIFTLMILNFIILVNNNNNSFTKHSSVIKLSNSQKNIDLPKIDDFANATLIKSNVINTGIFTNDTREIYWNLEAQNVNQKVYISINFTDITPTSLTKFSFYDKDYYDITTDEETIIQRDDSRFQVVISTYFNAIDSYYFVMNLTSGVSDIPLTGYNFSILLWVPSYGYDFQSAIPLEDDEINKFNFKVRGEEIYLLINTKINQRIFIDAWSDNIAEPIFLNSIMYIYENLNNDNELIDYAAESYGFINMTFKAELSDRYYILLQSGFANNYKGNFSVKLNKQKIGYDYSTAINVEINSTIIGYVNFTGKYEEKIYYKFEIPYSGVDVHLVINETELKPLVLENAIISIYDPGKNNKIFSKSESESDTDGRIEGNFYATTKGTYYIIVHAYSFARLGYFNIRIEYTIPEPFEWKFLSIILSILSLIIIPVSMYILDNKYMIEKRNCKYLNITSSIDAAFKGFNINPRFVKKRSFPDKLIFLRMSQYLGIDIRLEFDDISNEVTTLCTTRQKRNIEFFQYIIIGWIIYYLLNAIEIIFGHKTHLPLFISDIFILNQVFTLFLIIFIIGYIFTSGIWNYQYKNFLKESEHTINRIEHEMSITTNNKGNRINTDQIKKNVAYIRVLWNQAKKLFKEKNYGMFIIKTDTAVKKLVESRFLQIIDQTEYKDVKLDFNQLVEELRENGFDMPSKKKIEYYRKLRNKIVHSSEVIDEKQAIEVYSFYSKFLTRLGLRT